MGSNKNLINVVSDSKKVFIVAVILYFILRIVFIFRFPIFNDEALTIRYGRIAVETPMHFYTLAVGGKQPLLFWLDGILANIIPDPLMAGRLPSLLFGFLTLTGIFLLTRMVASRETAAFAAFIYAVSPISILFDGMAIHDAALACLFCWVCYFLLRLGKGFSWSGMVAIAICIGIGLWTKTTALLFLFISCFVAAILWRMKKISLQEALVLCLVWVGVSILIVLPLLYRPEFSGVVRMQSQYSLTVSDILRFPISTWYLNIRDSFLIYVGFLSPLALAAPIILLYKRNYTQGVRVLIMIFVITLFFLLLTAKSLHSRYLLFSTIPLYPLFALIKERLPKIFLASLIIILGLGFLLSFSPSTFFHLFPNKWIYSFERFQYVDGWPSGYGVGDALHYVDSIRHGEPAFIGVRWDAGNPEDTVLLYAPKLRNVISTFFDPKMEEFPQVVAEMKNRPIYFITRTAQRAGMDDNLTFLTRFYKPDGGESVEVYQYHPN